MQQSWRLSRLMKAELKFYSYVFGCLDSWNRSWSRTDYQFPDGLWNQDLSKKRQKEVRKKIGGIFSRLGGWGLERNNSRGVDEEFCRGNLRALLCKYEM